MVSLIDTALLNDVLPLFKIIDYNNELSGEELCQSL